MLYSWNIIYTSSCLVIYTSFSPMGLIEKYVNNGRMNEIGV